MPADLQTIPELSNQQRVLVNHYLSGLSGPAAARAAGYVNPEDCASRILRLPAVAHAIAVGRQESADRVKVTRDDVLQGFLDAVRASATATEMVMAWRELAKMQGHYAVEEKKITVEHKQGAVRRSQLEALSTEELIKMTGLPPSVIDAEYTMIPDDSQPAPDATPDDGV